MTITDVAKAAGVSASTVSRILNGRQDVAKATREHVLRVIEQLGYAPHVQAQHLRTGKTRNIALLFPLKYPGSLSYNTLEMDFIVGAATAAAEREFLFSLLTTFVTRQNFLSLYRSAQIDGLILMHIHMQDWRVDLLRANEYPFVMIGQCADNTGLNFIDLDFEGAVVAAFHNLMELGHRNIGFLTLPSVMRQLGFGPAVRAWTGYQQILRTCHIEPLYREANFASEDVFQATLSMINEQPEMTALVTTHELASRGIAEALKLRGRSIPNDCSLIAIMNEKIADLTTPSMTYIDFPAYSMGYQAIEMLIRSLQGADTSPEQVVIPPRLVQRGSTMALDQYASEPISLSN